MIIEEKNKSFINDDVKYFAKLFGRATLSFLKINIFGQIAIAVLTAVTMIFIIYTTFYSGGGPVHASGQAAFLVLFIARPVSFGLTVIYLLSAPFLLFSFGNKYVISRTINRLITERGEQLLFPFIDKILVKVKERQPDLFKNGVDKTKLKLKILQEIKDSKENKWLKKIITFGLKKIELNEVDFKDENLSFTEILKTKIIDQLKSISEPSRAFFWIILGFQSLVLVLTVFKVI